MRLIQRSRRTQKMLSYTDLAAELGESETEIRKACGNLKRKGLITGGPLPPVRITLIGNDSDQDRRNVRLSVRMECCTRDAPIAAAFFDVFQKILGSRFPRALVLSRQYDIDMHDPDPDEDDTCGEALIDTGGGLGEGGIKNIIFRSPKKTK